MQPAPLISVLIACYNCEKYLAAALSSVLAQTYTNFEIILVDDGSTDRSAEIAAGYLSDRVRLIRQSNRGAAKARNVAFDLANGDFVLFLDADDVVAPTHLNALSSVLRKNPDCVALAQWSRFRHDPSEAFFPCRPTEHDLPGPDWLILDWKEARPMTQSGMILLPKKLVTQHGGWDERLSLIDDFEFFARMISRSNGVRFAPGARLYYRSGVHNSLSSRKTRDAVESAYLSLTLGITHLLEMKNTSATRLASANLLLDFDYTNFPLHADLRSKARKRILELGGAVLEPDGPPGFQKLKRLIGWRGARLVQKMLGR